MKLTNEDLRRIILEEVEAVLSEDEHPAIGDSSEKLVDLDDAEDEDENKQLSRSEFGTALMDTGKDLKSTSDTSMKPRETGVASEILQDILGLTTQEGDATVLLNKIRSAVERVIKSSKG